jgi:hypothetical protein
MTEESHDPRTVDQPSGAPPDAGLAYDPEMTDADEANIPPESDADPEAHEEPHEPGRPEARD